MGHRLITALIFLNVMGFLACVALIAAAVPKDDAVVLAQVTNSVFISIRMFVVGAAVPTVAWGIAALEFDRSRTKKRLLASATMYALLVVSLILFCVAGWRLPRAFLESLQITVEFSDTQTALASVKIISDTVAGWREAGHPLRDHSRSSQFDLSVSPAEDNSTSALVLDQHQPQSQRPFRARTRGKQSPETASGEEQSSATAIPNFSAQTLLMPALSDDPTGSKKR